VDEHPAPRLILQQCGFERVGDAAMLVAYLEAAVVLLGRNEAGEGKQRPRAHSIADLEGLAALRHGKTERRLGAAREIGFAGEGPMAMDCAGGSAFRPRRGRRRRDRREQEKSRLPHRTLSLISLPARLRAAPLNRHLI